MSRDEGRTDGLGTEGYRDEVLALFQAIWHLKDWIRNDSEFTQLHDVEKWVNSDANHLLIAADVANGSKHLRLVPRAEGSEQSRNDVVVMIGRGVLHTFYIRDARPPGGEFEAVELADQCIQEWISYLALCFVEVPSS